MTQLQWKLLTLGGPVSPPPLCSLQPQLAWRQIHTLRLSRTKPERGSGQLTSQGTSSLLRLCFELSWAHLECRLFQMHPFAVGKIPAPGSRDGASTRAPLLQTSHQKHPLLTRNYDCYVQIQGAAQASSVPQIVLSKGY